MLSNIKGYQSETVSQWSPSQNSPYCCTPSCLFTKGSLLILTTSCHVCLHWCKMLRLYWLDGLEGPQNEGAAGNSFFNFWNFAFQNQKVCREPKNMPLYKTTPPEINILTSSQKLVSQDFWWIANSVLNKGKSTIPSLFNVPEVLSSVALSSSLFMFYLISFSPHFIVHVSPQFRQSTLHWSCFIFIFFSPQSISFISPTTVYLIHIYLIWLFSYYMVIQAYCQFHFPANPVSGN